MAGVSKHNWRIALSGLRLRKPASVGAPFDYLSKQSFLENILSVLIFTLPTVMNPSSRLRESAPADHHPAPATLLPALTDADRRAIIGVCDQLAGVAGRTALMMALRGSRAQRVLRFKVEQARGYGHYAGVPEAEVMARIDALIAEELLCIRYHEGFPLLGYTEQGLTRAIRYAAEEWLDLLRARVQPVGAGATLELPFLMTTMPQRNYDTLLQLVKLVGQVADKAWLPLLRAWQAAETKRLRAQIAPIIAALEKL